jgi:membrane-associated protein
MHWLDFPWDAFSAFYDLIVNFDQHIHTWVAHLGWWIYLVSFVIICLETGVIIFPFLPGDSLLFALGAVCASSAGGLNPLILVIVLIAAGTAGGLLNYATGKFVGPRIFQRESKWFSQENLSKTHAFYEKHGGKAIVLARFIPIFRTFVPFVAGVGSMDYRRFFIFNFCGAFCWIISLVLAGNYFGNIPIVKKNFGAVVPMVIIISVLPIFFEVMKKRRGKKPNT